MNFTALSVRLVSTWRSRTAVALDEARAARADIDGAEHALLARPRLQFVADALDQLMQIEHRAVELEAAGLELGIVENVVQHRMQALCRLLQRLGIAPLRGVEPGVEQKLGHGDHRAERRAELVAHHGDQLGLGPVGGLSLYALLPLGLDRLDKALDLGKEIVRPEIFRFHASVHPFSVRSGNNSRNHLRVG